MKLWSQTFQRTTKDTLCVANRGQKEIRIMKKNSMEKLEQKMIKVGDVKLATYNPRIMLNDDMEELKKSILAFGLVEPMIVNKDMTLIGGHQRLKASIELGFTEVPCVILDLDKKQEKVLNLALNKIGGFFDEERLSEIINELKHDAIGFNESEIEQYLVQTELRTEVGEYNPEDDEDIRALFERNEKVQVKVAEPNEMKNQNKLAFYTETFEQYSMLRDFFKTTRKGELDTKKCINLIEEHGNKE